MVIDEYIQRVVNAQWGADSWLWLSLVALMLFLIALMNRREGVLTPFFRGLALVLVVAALAMPFERESSESKELITLLDVSNSVRREALEASVKAIRDFALSQKEATLTVYPFAKSVSPNGLRIDGSEGLGKIWSEIEDSAESLERGESDLAQAVRFAGKREGVSSVLLYTDGWETTGNVLELVRRGGIGGARIYPVLGAGELYSEERLDISSIYAPITINADEKVEVRVAVRNTKKQEASGRLEIDVDGKKILSQVVSVLPGEERLTIVEAPPVDGGLHRIRAVLRKVEGGEGSVLSEEHRWYAVKTKEKVLILSGEDDDERVIAKLLGLKGFAVESIVADGSRPIPAALTDYSTVIFNNIARRQLPTQLLPNLKTFVQGGGGVLLVGGARSFGLGGYIDTELEEISPLKFVPPQTKKKRLNNAVILLLDKSRSMLSDGKIEAAKKAAYTAINSLKDDDYVGVIGFDTGPFAVISLSPVTEAKELADRRLRNLTASGQTNLLPSLAMARKALATAPVSRKHIILLTDGKFPAHEGGYQNEVAQIKAEGVSLSSVALGVEADVPLLKMMASVGKGAFYHTLDPSRLPEIFMQDIKVTSGEETMKEDSEFPVVAGPVGVQSVSMRTFPALTGFVETLPKKGSNLELITRKGEGVFPVLGSWQFGEGRVIAFTSDANGRWSLPWLRWDGFVRFWTDIVNQLKTRASDKRTAVDFDLRYSLVGRSLVFDLAVFDKKLETELPPVIKAKVEEPGKEVKEVQFSGYRKGRFAATLDAARSGDYRLSINYGALAFPPMAITVPKDIFGEKPGRGINAQLLSDLALTSGGAINPEPGNIVWHRSIKEKVNYLLSPLLLLGALVLLLESFVREKSFSVFASLWPKNKQVGYERNLSGVYGQRSRKGDAG